MVAVSIVYEGELRCSATHGPSGAVISTDAPKDNHGKGESFSPTDLVGAALGSCMLTVMGITARRLKLDISGSRVRVEKEMVSAPVRRIGRLVVTMEMPMALSEEHRQALHEAALHCPVKYSLHPDIEVAMTFKWHDGLRAAQ